MSALEFKRKLYIKGIADWNYSVQRQDIVHIAGRLHWNTTIHHTELVLAKFDRTTGDHQILEVLGTYKSHKAIPEMAKAALNKALDELLAPAYIEDTAAELEGV